MHRRTFLKLTAAFSMGGLVVGMERLLAYASIPAPFPVYLTFEGGPSVKSDGTGTTIDVLNALKKYNAPATFFVTGRNLHDWDTTTLSRMLAEGHAVGNRLDIMRNRVE
ncbi:MAG: polysaccharide deacetylase family protein [Aggregatilineales bacterium]